MASARLLGLFDLSHQQAATEMVLDESIEAGFVVATTHGYILNPMTKYLAAALRLDMIVFGCYFHR
jgi:hypothetical protein